MNDLNQLLTSDVALWWLLSLGHFLWQAVLLFLMACFARFVLLKRASALTHYSIWYSALIVMFCLPCGNFAFFALHHRTPKPETNIPREIGQTELSIESQSNLNRPAAPTVITQESIDPAWLEPAVIPVNDAQPTPQPRPPIEPAVHSTWSEHLTRTLIITYLLGSFLLLTRLLLGMLGTKRLSAIAQHLEQHNAIQNFRRQSQHLHGLARIPIAQCPRVLSPVVVGLLHPIVLLPRQVLRQLNADELQAILLHELAHIKRRDPLMNLLQRIIEALLFFHPLVWITSRAASHQRENCCDDLAIKWGGEPCCYADSLVKLSELRQPGATIPQTALAASGQRPTQLRTRVLRILGAPLPPVGLPATRISLTIAMLLLGIVTISAFAAQDTPQEEAVQQDNTRKDAVRQDDTPQDNQAETEPAPNQETTPSRSEPAAEANLTHPKESDIQPVDLPDGIYEITYPDLTDKPVGTKVPRTDSDGFVYVKERLTDKLGEVGMHSVNNQNTRFIISMQGAGPIPKGRDIGILALIEDGYCAVIGSHSDPGREQRLDLTAYTQGEAADHFANALKVKPLLRQHPGHEFKTDFADPLFPTYQFKVGEPATIQLQIKNTGDIPMKFLDGGKQRGARNNQFRFLAYRNSGKGAEVPDSGDPINFGGIGVFVELKPGESFTKEVDITKWFDLSQPDTYLIKGHFDFTLMEDFDGWDSSRQWDEVASGQCYVQIVTEEEMVAAGKEVEPGKVDAEAIRDEVYLQLLKEAQEKIDRVEHLHKQGVASTTALTNARLAYWELRIKIAEAKQRKTELVTACKECVKLTKQEYDRVNAVKQRGAVSQTELDGAETKWLFAKLKLAEAEGNLYQQFMALDRLHTIALNKLERMKALHDLAVISASKISEANKVVAEYKLRREAVREAMGNVDVLGDENTFSLREVWAHYPDFKFVANSMLESKFLEEVEARGLSPYGILSTDAPGAKFQGTTYFWSTSDGRQVGVLFRDGKLEMVQRLQPGQFDTTARKQTSLLRHRNHIVLELLPAMTGNGEEPIIWLDKKQVDREQLSEHIEQLKRYELKVPLKLEIRADRDAKYQEIQQIIEWLRALGVEQFSLKAAERFPIFLVPASEGQTGTIRGEISWGVKGQDRLIVLLEHEKWANRLGELPNLAVTSGEPFEFRHVPAGDCKVIAQLQPANPRTPSSTRTIGVKVHPNMTSRIDANLLAP